MYMLLFIFLSLLATFLQSVTWSTDPWTQKLQEACNNAICEECVTEVLCAKLLDAFKTIWSLQLSLALKAMAAC